MKKAKSILALILVLSLLVCPVVALAASDISGAKYYGTIVVSSNSSSAVSNVSVNFTLSTPNLISTGYLNSSANNSVIRSGGGVDLPFMPGANASSPWLVWLPALGPNASTGDILYTAESTGGEIRYFPADEGMTSSDNTTMELGDNFTIEQSGWWDTDAGNNKLAAHKPVAFRTFVSPTVSGNITSGIGGMVDNFDKDYWTDVGTKIIVDTGNSRIDYESERSAVDTRCFSDLTSVSDTSWTLDFTITPTAKGGVGGSSLLGWGLWETAANWAGYGDDALFIFVSGTDTYTIGCYDNGALTTSGTIAFTVGTTYFITLERNTAILSTLSVFTNAGRTVHTAGSPVTLAVPATVVSLRYIQASNQDDNNGVANEVIGWIDDVSLTPLVQVTATSVESGEHIVTTTANTTHMWIDIDGDTKDTVALGGVSVPDNTFDWTFLQNNVMPYMEYQKIWIDGVLQQHIVWEYDTTFTDLSGKDHDATPSFRTTSSNPSVSAVLTSFLPVAEAKAPSYVLTGAPAFIEDTAPIVDDWGMTPPAGTFPLAGVITNVANATGTPAQLPLLIIAAVVILGLSLAFSGLMRKGGSGTVFGKVLVIVAIMGLFIAIENFGVTFWMLVIFFLIGLTICVASRHATWN